MDGSKELSPAPSASGAPVKGLKSVLAKARLGRKDNPSTASLNGSDESEIGGLRNSVDSVDKIRDGGRSSVDDGLPTGPSGLSKLIPGRVKKKRKKREEAEQLQQELAEGRGRSADDQTATAAVQRGEAGNESRTTLGEESGSLITVESDIESPAVSPIRPPVISHPSHIDYLTSSSPLIKTTPTTDPPGAQLDGPDFHTPQYQKSYTLPNTTSATSLSSNLAPHHAATMDTREGGRSQSAADGNRSRGVSPGARIKDVFTIGSRKKDISPPKSPEPGPSKSSGEGNALTGLFKKDKRNSVVGRPASESVQPGEDGPQSPTTSMRSVPTIITEPSTPPKRSLEAPETHVTPPTPTDQRPEMANSPSLNSRLAGSESTNGTTVISPSGNMISHRRARSDSATQPPSKLSNVMSAPLTPMIEESKTPGARTPGQQGPPGGGFFSSVFSAAQNAANQLSNSITNNNQPRSRSSTQSEEVDEKRGLEGTADLVAEAEDRPVSQEKKLAVDTLGSGDLSLSHLGIGTDFAGNNSSTSTLPNGSSEKGDNGNLGHPLVHREEAAARAEDVSAARAVSAAYSEQSLQNSTVTPVAEDVAAGVRPRSTYESSIMTGDKTPPNGSLYEGNQGIRRSGSVRSRVQDKITKRHRNSSSATGGTIAAAIAAGNAALANPASSGTTPRLTGFAVATKKRNRDFHQLFRSVPEDDYLIEDYSCALQRDIILAGRIYISEAHICFSSNILGWVTTLIISFDEIVSVEKESTAMVFPNAIAIQTLHARHTFRSLLSREATYDLIIGIWKINHPSLKSSLNGVRLDQGGTGDKTEKADPSGSDDASDASEDEEEVYDEDEEEDEGTGSFTEVPERSFDGSDLPSEQQVGRKASNMGLAAGAAANGTLNASAAKVAEQAVGTPATQDFPGPPTHAPTECGDSDTHLDKFLKDDIIPAPLGKVYSMVFGTASTSFVPKWLMEEIKCTELQMENAQQGLSEERPTRNFSYIKPLYASIGPKSTKCVVNDNLDSMDFEKAICVTQSTQTPDVPSGNVFVTKTHFCFMWAPGNATRLLINFTIEWTGKSWLKGPIEKGAADGQKTYCDELVKALKAGVTSRARAGTIGSKTKTKGKRKKGDTTPSSKSPTFEMSTKKPAEDASWGLFEPLHGILGPIADILGPIITPNIIIGFLLLVILVNYIRSPSSSSSSSLSYTSGVGVSPQRIAAYEELWRREESDLWDWMEERLGVAYPVGERDQKAVVQARAVREKIGRKEKGKGKKGGRMSEREVEEAIRVTEERLGVLKRVIREGKGGAKEPSSADVAGVGEVADGDGGGGV